MDKAKQQKEFGEVYKKYVNDIFRFCYLRISDREVAKDVSQQVFLKAWDSVQNGNILDNPRAFLYQIARNLVIDWYRKKKENSLDQMIEEDGYDVPDHDSVQNIHINSDMKSVLKVIKTLAKEDGDVVMMRYVDGMAVNEIALLLGERENTVSVRIYRAVEKIRSIMVKQ